MFGKTDLDQNEQTAASTKYKKRSIRKMTMDQKEEMTTDQVWQSATQIILKIEEWWASTRLSWFPRTTSRMTTWTRWWSVSERERIDGSNVILFLLISGLKFRRFLKQSRKSLIFDAKRSRKRETKLGVKKFLSWYFDAKLRFAFFSWRSRLVLIFWIFFAKFPFSDPITKPISLCDINTLLNHFYFSYTFVQRSLLTLTLFFKVIWLKKTKSKSISIARWKTVF